MEVERCAETELNEIARTIEQQNEGNDDERETKAYSNIRNESSQNQIVTLERKRLPGNEDFNRVGSLQSIERVDGLYKLRTKVVSWWRRFSV